MELYEQESAQKFTELETGREKGDYDLMARAAHSLAGSSANLGGREVWRIAKEIENLCKGRKGPQACELLAGLEDAYASTIIALKAYMKSCSTEAGK
jgi:HPt (histidine-containing phosphotransfer) domain-containing protein